MGRLVICGIEVVDASSEASIHEWEVLVGEGDVEDEIRLEIAEVGGGSGDVISIDSGGGYGDTGALFYRGGDGIALRDCAGGESDFGKNGRDLGAFVSDHATDSAGSYDEYV